MGVRPLASHWRRWDDGGTLQLTPGGDAWVDAFGFPYYQMHRADVLRCLMTALPAERVHTGYRLLSFRDLGDRVEASFANGESVRLDALIGADGIHSTVQKLLFGDREARFTGCAAYRGLVPAERLRSLNLEVNGEYWMGPGASLVQYFVRNGELVNFVASIDRYDWTSESWTDAADIKDALAHFEGWHPQVRGLLEAADETFIWALFDRPPLERWSVGRVTLLGDACHPMVPFAAQGAAQSIEDGATLTACLAQTDSAGIPDALQRYEQLRLPRTSMVQAAAAAMRTRFHLPDGPEQQERDAQMATGTTAAANAFARIWGHDATVLGQP